MKCQCCGARLRLLGATRRGIATCVDCRSLPIETIQALARLRKNIFDALAWHPMEREDSD